MSVSPLIPILLLFAGRLLLYLLEGYIVINCRRVIALLDESVYFDANIGIIFRKVIALLDRCVSLEANIVIICGKVIA